MLELDGVAYGKPADDEAAAGVWRRNARSVRGAPTGHWLLDERSGGTGATLGAVTSTVVHFADLGDADIEEYVARAKPTRVAGAFTTDGLGPSYAASRATTTRSSPSALPLLRGLLAELGFSWSSLWRVRPAEPRAGGR